MSRRTNTCPAASAAAGPDSGHTLFELLVALTLSAIVAASTVEAVRQLKYELALEAGRMTVRRAAALTRRLARARSESFVMTTTPGSGILRVSAHGRPTGGDAYRLELPAGVLVSRATAGGQIRFSSDGSANNSTITLTSSGSAASRTVIINQRGMIR